MARSTPSAKRAACPSFDTFADVRRKTKKHKSYDKDAPLRCSSLDQSQISIERRGFHVISAVSHILVSDENIEYDIL